MMFLLMALAAAAPPPPEADPFAAPPQGEVASLIRSAQFGEAGADAAIAAWLRQHPAASRSDQARLEHRLCGDLRARNANAAAAGACAAAAALGADDRQAAADAVALREVPPISASGGARVPLTPNGLGSGDASVSVNGVAAPWLVDTGAQITVVSASLARRIGLQPLHDPVTVHSATGFARGDLALIDQLSLGGARVDDVPVLILPDDQLTIADRPPIQAILGLPVLVAFGRVAWLDGGATLALGEAAPAPAPDAARLYWHEEGVGLPVSTERGTRGAALDTGANVTYLRAPAHALLSAATEASGAYRRAQVGGAGGVMQTNEKTYPQVTLDVAGVPMALAEVSLNEGEREGAARLGDDIPRRLAMLSLDFDAMRVTARALTAARPATAGAGALTPRSPAAPPPRVGPG
jgi:clan AA aspartic protease (TIGR02281 family)